MSKDLQKNLLVFSLLATQAELYGYALKGSVKNEFNNHLVKYLKSSKHLVKYINQFIDAETLEDSSEEIANFIEKLIQSNNTNN
jgi:GTP-binding protein EngB required for normal cell division